MVGNCLLFQENFSSLRRSNLFPLIFMCLLAFTTVKKYNRKAYYSLLIDVYRIMQLLNGRQP